MIILQNLVYFQCWVSTISKTKCGKCGFRVTPADRCNVAARTVAGFWPGSLHSASAAASPDTRMCTQDCLTTYPGSTCRFSSIPIMTDTTRINRSSQTTGEKYQFMVYKSHYRILFNFNFCFSTGQTLSSYLNYGQFYLQSYKINKLSQEYFTTCLYLPKERTISFKVLLN